MIPDGERPEPIHTAPPLCFIPVMTLQSDITCSININKVTCARCVYFFFNPEARMLNSRFEREDYFSHQPAGADGS